MVTTYTFFIRNSSTGLGVGSLTPTWNTLYYVETAAAVGSGAGPVISEVGGGWYTFAYDPSATAGGIVGTVDAGATVTGADRYIAVAARLDASERADTVIQILHNTHKIPTGPDGGVETIQNRDGGTLATYERVNTLSTTTRTPTGDL
jgi:hypothetical protein